MPRRTYACQSCGEISIFESSNPKKRCKCGGTQFTRAAFPSAKTALPPVITTPTPVKETAPVSPIPEPPKGSGPTFTTHAPVKYKTVPTAGTTLQEQIANTGMKSVNRDKLQYYAAQKGLAVLPDSPGGVIDKIIRCAVKTVQITSVPGIRVKFPVYIPFQGGRCTVTLSGLQTIDLKLILKEMVEGKCRPSEHGNANTVWGNRDDDLPTWIGEKTGFMDEEADEGWRPTFREYGWLYQIPVKYRSTTQAGKVRLAIGALHKEDGSAISLADPRDRGSLEVFVGGAVSQNAGKVDAGFRLVVSDWGYVFFTPDHYETFYIYDPTAGDGAGKWVKYERDGWAETSWRQRGLFHDGHGWKKLPATAPSYW